MSRYQYEDSRHPLVGRRRYRVLSGGHRIGEVHRTYKSRTWVALLITDPTIVGRGATRDRAVDDAYSQVGGPG